MVRRWVALTGALCAGCASMHSTPLTEGETLAEGLVYHLPRRDVVVKVTVSDKAATQADPTTSKITDITVERGPAYADLSQRFALGFERSAFANHSIDVGISVDGLLTKSDATYTATLAAALDSITDGVGASRAQGPSTKACSTPGVHVFVLPVRPRSVPCEAALVSHQTICGDTMQVLIEEQHVAAPRPAHSASAAPPPSPATCSPSTGHGNQARVGVFYRQSQPYRVQVIPAPAGFNVVQTLLLPTRSPTRFLPMDRALFADTSAKVAFDSGEPTKLVQTANGEGSELIKLPAKWAQAYFAAVGAVLTGLTNRDSQRADAAAAQARALAAQQQLALCRAAASAKPVDPALVEAACRIDAGQ